MFPGRIVHGTLEDARFPDGRFAVVVLSDLLEHVREPMIFLREVRRVLRPGGRLLIVTPDLGSLSARKMVDSTILAGVSGARDENLDGVWDLFDPAMDTWKSEATIKSIKITGARDGTADFVNSNIEAYNVVSASLCFASTIVGGQPFGLACHLYSKITYWDETGADTYTNRDPLNVFAPPPVDNMEFRIV